MEQVLYRKKYTVTEFYKALYKGVRTFKFLRRSKKSGELSEQFVKRIMLAVTEVNGCEVCSYVHTNSALEMGMSDKEIKHLLTGVMDNVPAEEMKAILFAQHYADTKGYPTKGSWDEIKSVYGEQTTMGILGAIRVIMVDNSYGIALSAFKSRMKGELIEKSSLFYEIRMLLSVIPLLPTAIIHAIFSNILKRPVVKFGR
jgi:AhpD family alkylhydroperoxidase